MNMKYPLVILNAMLLLAAAGSQAAIIYSQDFGGTGTDVLDDTAVQTGTGTWQAGATFTTSGNLTGTARRTSAVLPFNPVQGEIYELTATIELTNAGFLGLGFADNASFTGNSSAQNDNNSFRFASGTIIPGYSWIMLNGTSDLAPAYSSLLVAATGTPPSYTTGPADLKIVLNASNETDWVTTYFLNGTLYATSTTAAAILDSAIDSVGLTSGNGLGTIRDFQLQTIPEPEAALLGGLGMLALLRRRRS